MSRETILELLKDKPSELLEVTEAFDKAGAAAKIQAANADLTSQREAWQKTEGSLKSQIAELSKGDGKTANQAELTALKDKLAEVEGKVSASEAKAAAAEAARLASDVKSSIIGTATEASDPETVYILLQAKGLAGVDKEGKPFYHRLNDKQEHAACTAAEAVKDFLDKNVYLKKATGSQGSGMRTAATGATANGLLKNVIDLL